MGKVILLCGKRGTGKTTYGRKLKESINGVMLSCDDFIEIFDENKMSIKHNPALGKLKVHLVHTALDIVKAGANVILDIDLWSGHERKTVLKFFEKNNIETQLHYIKSKSGDKVDYTNISIESMESNSTYYVDSIIRNLFEEDFDEPDDEDIDVLLIN